MRALISFICLFLLSWVSEAQVFWSELAPMPERVSNNAVTAATVNGDTYVYSFAGIDSTKTWSGIHKKAWSYSVDNDHWEAIDPLPNGNGRIAAGASTVKNRIYIIGGYEVFSNGNEASFDEVHIYDPETNTYLPDGAPCPVPIDDHIQAVWRDSLIYVVTGWSNNGNVSTVQIYNPSEDEWMIGTPTPGSDEYNVFGGSGIIIGDVIYYMGGAADFCCNPVFPATNFLRIGEINPDDPTEINWTHVESDFAVGYRMGAILNYDHCPTWVGGSDLTYNYDGIDYNGSGGVEPRTRAVLYGVNFGGSFFEWSDNAIPIMDLRGAAYLEPYVYILAGGMGPGQVVSNKTYLMEVGILYSASEEFDLELEYYPNPSNGKVHFDPEGAYDILVTGLDGRILLQTSLAAGEPLATGLLPSGLCLVRITDSEGKIKVAKLVIP